MWKILFIAVIIIMSNPIAYGQDMSNDNLIILPAPDSKGRVALEAAINKRRSIRSYEDADLTYEQIGQLLWAAQGITDKRGYRASPSAGALYPLEIYITNKDGFFHYIPNGHKLKKISGEDLRGKLQQVTLFQTSVKTASVDIIICGIYERVTSRYGQRGVRYTDIEVGHAAQNIHLQAVALGLGSVPIGAYKDEAVGKVLSLPEDQVPLYIIPVGYEK